LWCARLVGVVEGEALPWPAVVVTPLCVESLEQRTDRFADEPYTLPQAVAWAVEVALNLHRLHRESRLRHGDVTLRNVLLGRDGRAYLADTGVAEHNHPYGRQPQQEGQGKCYSASVAPEVVGHGGGEGAPDARADVWSWGGLLRALLTRSTATAKGDSVSAYTTLVEDEQWWEETAAQWGGDELPRGVFKAVKHSLCERGERVELLTGAVLLGQGALVAEEVGEVNVPEEVKEAELRTAVVESRVPIPVRGGTVSLTEGTSAVGVLRALSKDHRTVGDEAQAVACLRQAARLFPDPAVSLERRYPF
jgi:hypothetical protein